MTVQGSVHWGLSDVCSEKELLCSLYAHIYLSKHLDFPLLLQAADPPVCHRAALCASEAKSGDWQ